ncbi:MAG TPA: right-handed parallel beta-helix repeat-containing protein [Nitrososphaeraceae archaeon]|nr:right-handed parallel beta-helix repeat-containing protein [Nitrososphaeraceae archaeon]
MNRTLLAYVLAAIISFSTVATITMQPISLRAQTQQAVPQLQAQQASQEPLAVSPSCGQVITQNVVLTSNLKCADSDGLIVGASDIVIDLNGNTISGPDAGSQEKTSSKVGIMVPNVNNVVIQDGTIEGFQAGVMMSGSQNVEIKGIVSKDNQIGFFSTGASIVNAHLSIPMNNQIGFAAHSTQQLTVENNIIYQNTMAGITLVNSDNAVVTLNSITESGNGLYLDNQSDNNNVNFNNVLLNTIDLNNANGLPVNTNTNTFDQNNCMTSNPSGICIGK